MNAPKFTFSEQDNTLGVGALAKGISGFMGKFLKGPFSNPDEVIYNWQQFEAIYGGFTPNTTDPILVYRALNSGANLRINRVGHYNDLTDAESLTAEKAQASSSVVILLDRDTASGSNFTCTLMGVPIAVVSEGNHEDYMEDIRAALTLPGITKAFLFKTENNQNLRGILVCSLLSQNINLENPTFTGNINGPSVRASTIISPTSSVAAGKVYTLVNSTKGTTLSSYTAEAGDTQSDVVQGLFSNVLGGNGYTYSQSGANLTVNSPLTPYPTNFNGDVISLSEVLPGIEEVRASVTHQIAVGGTIGEQVTINSSNYGPLGVYTIQSGFPTATGIAAVINQGSSGFSAQGFAGTLILRAPVGEGDLANGDLITFDTAGVFEVQNPSATLAGGITAVAPSSAQVTEVLGNGQNGGTGNPILDVQDFFVGANAEVLSMCRFKPKFAGLGGNNLKITISNASNGLLTHFNLRVEDVTNPSLTETYVNLLVEGTTVETQNWLDVVNSSSSLIEAEYISLAGTYTEPKRPLNCEVRFMAGTDGDPVEIGDYIGSQEAGIGFHAFNPYNDMMQFCTGEASTIELHEAAAEYADRYKSMVYVGHIDSNLSYTQMVALMESSSIDTSWAAFYTGSLRIKHPATNVPMIISEIGDVLGAFARSDSEYGEWAAVFNVKRGLISSTQGVYKNFGGESNYEILNLLANNRINCVITENGKTMIWGNTTAQKTTSVLQFLNIRRLGLMIKKTLSPVMKEYLSEPNVPSTWFNIYVRVKPFLDGLVQKEALYSYTWKGDQFANENLSDLVVNNALEVQSGKYKAILSASAVPGMNEFDLVLTYDFTTGTVEIETA